MANNDTPVGVESPTVKPYAGCSRPRWPRIRPFTVPGARGRVRSLRNTRPAALIPVVFGAALLAMTGCNGLMSSISGIPIAPSGPVVSSFAAFGVDNYPYPFSQNPSLTNQSQLAINASLQLRQDGWTDVNGQAITDPLGESPTAGPGNQNVSVQSIQSAVNAGASLIVFAGHGDPGDIEFSGDGGSFNNDYQFWGEGSGIQSGNYYTRANTDSTGGSLAGHNLKWMVLSSSDTVAPDSNMDPTDNDANFQVAVGAWSNFFYSGFPSATLRSLFGYWQSPGNCAQSAFDGTQRDCDVSVGPDATAMAGFLSQIWPYPYNPTGSPTMNSAWEQANQTAGLGDVWSIVQDCNACGPAGVTVSVQRVGTENGHTTLLISVVVTLQGSSTAMPVSTVRAHVLA